MYKIVTNDAAEEIVRGRENALARFYELSEDKSATHDLYKKDKFGWGLILHYPAHVVPENW